MGRGKELLKKLFYWYRYLLYGEPTETNGVLIGVYFMKTDYGNIHIEIWGELSDEEKERKYFSILDKLDAILFEEYSEYMIYPQRIE